MCKKLYAVAVALPLLFAGFGAFDARAGIDRLSKVSPPTGRLHAVVVGIDNYEAEGSRLKGAVADARDIATALETRGANVRLVLDGAATLPGIMTAWWATVAEAKAGDTIVFTFSGHANGFPERTPGDEADGKDETLILVDFQSGTPDRAVLRDDDLARLLAMIPDIHVVVVLDTHAGTGVDRAAASPQVLYFGGAPDGEMIQEELIDGAARGALSWAFARALEDTAAEVPTSADEMKSRVVKRVVEVTDARQRPVAMGGASVRIPGAPGTTKPSR